LDVLVFLAGQISGLLKSEFVSSVV